MNQKLSSIVDQLKELTLLEAAELVKEIEVTFGIDTSVSVASIGTGAISQSPPPIVEAVEEKTSFEVILSDVPSDKKIAILKVVRNVTGLGLKESKDIVDNIPKLLKEGVSKEESETIKKEIESSGGKVIIK